MAIVKYMESIYIYSHKTVWDIYFLKFGYKILVSINIYYYISRNRARNCKYFYVKLETE